MNTQSLHSLKVIITLIYLSFFSISAFAGCIYSEPLAVKEVEIGNMLSWETSDEQNNKMFIIQKSFDAKNFENIGEVKASGEVGENSEYRFLDIAIGTENVYYRLSQMDYSGKTSYSHIVKMNRTSNNNFMITSMNSTMTSAFFSFEINSTFEGVLKYKVLSAEKIKMLEGSLFLEKKENNDLFIDLTELPRGDYDVIMFSNKELEKINITKVLPGDMPLNEFVIKN